MTINELFTIADDVKPNAFTKDDLTRWLNEVEGMVQTRVLLLAPEEIISYSYEEDKDKELLVSPPYDKLYLPYLEARIDYTNGEYNRYQNSMQLFNSFFSEFMNYFALRYRPADTHSPVYTSEYNYIGKGEDL